MKRLILFISIHVLLFNVIYGQQEQIVPDIWMKGDKVILNVNAEQQTTDVLTSRSLDGGALLNFNYVLPFSESLEVIKIPYPFDEGNRYTVFTVYFPGELGKDQGIWGFTDSSRDMILTTTRIAGPTVSDFEKEVPAATPIIHTVSQYWPSSTGQTESQHLCIGSTGQLIEGVDKFEGLIPEVILFNSSLNNLQRNIIETYLAIKYGVTLNETDYRNTNEDIIWNFEQNKNFAQRIAGIGRDDVIDLGQYQSTTSVEPDVLSIGINDIAASNQLNTGELQDLDFLVWGDNGQPLAFDIAGLGNAQKVAFSSRKWKIQASGLINEVNTKVLLNSEGLVIPEGYELALVIDRSGKGQFEGSGRLDLYPAVNNEGTKLVGFAGVKWDTDGSGADVFAFALQPKTNNIIKSFTVSPNPSSGSFQVDVKLLERSSVDLSIYNLNGMRVRHVVADKHKRFSFPFDLEHSGDYIIVLRSNNQYVSKPLIITTK
jgi:hypothetical protein